MYFLSDTLKTFQDTFRAEEDSRGTLQTRSPNCNHESPINGLTLAEETRHRRWIPCPPPLSLYTRNLPRGSLPTVFRASPRNTSKVCSRVHSSLTQPVVEILHEMVTRQCPSGNFELRAISNVRQFENTWTLSQWLAFFHRLPAGK